MQFVPLSAGNFEKGCGLNASVGIKGKREHQLCRNEQLDNIRCVSMNWGIKVIILLFEVCFVKKEILKNYLKYLCGLILSLDDFIQRVYLLGKI